MSSREPWCGARWGCFQHRPPGNGAANRHEKLTHCDSKADPGEGRSAKPRAGDVRNRWSWSTTWHLLRRYAKSARAMNLLAVRPLAEATVLGVDDTGARFERAPALGHAAQCVRSPRPIPSKLTVHGESFAVGDRTAPQRSRRSRSRTQRCPEHLTYTPSPRPAHGVQQCSSRLQRLPRGRSEAAYRGPSPVPRETPLSLPTLHLFHVKPLRPLNPSPVPRETISS